MEELKPCPFCGGESYFDREGTCLQSCIVQCEDCGCKLETNEQGFDCGSQWNRRAGGEA
jgi:Lar family restriction alleviation protein